MQIHIEISNIRIRYRKFSEVNINRFRRMIEDAHWNDVYIYKDDTNLAYQSFFQIVKNIFDHCFPLSSLKSKKAPDSKPWFSLGLLKSSIKKHKLYKRYLSNPTRNNADSYKKI